MMKFRFFLLLFVAVSCTQIKEETRLDITPDIFPDYIGVTIPPNIAPLTFTVKETENNLYTEFSFRGEVLFSSKGEGKAGLSISEKKWRKMLSLAKGSSVQVKVFSQLDNGKWVSYKPFDLYISEDEIDSYLVYRLIKPGYELWDRMGLYQRDMTSFKENVIIENLQLTSKPGLGCVNCHSFCEYNADTFMYHGRAIHAGTVIVRGEDTKLVNFKTSETGNGVYPKWHPTGRFIAYSLNDTKQAFHAFDENKISVYDLESDLMVFDVGKNEVITDHRFLSSSYFETFPTWSPDGKWLYFSRADAHENLPVNNDKMKYGIYRIAFDAQTACLGDSLECVVNEKVTGKSQLFTRISPDGRYLLYTECDYGTFPIWHKESELRMIDLQTMLPVEMSLVNSNDVDSYHSWSSNSRWIVFSSRRIDGLYTRLYIASMNKNGQLCKPFLLPQKTADFDWLRMKSYNIPEFTKNKMSRKARDFEKIQKGEPTKVSLKKN